MKYKDVVGVICVIEIASGIISAVTSHIQVKGKEKEAVKAAESDMENKVTALNPCVTDSDMSVILDDGYYCHPNGRDDIALCWSTVAPALTDKPKDMQNRCMYCGLENDGTLIASKNREGCVICSECASSKPVRRNVRLEDGHMVNHCRYRRRIYFEAKSKR